MYEKGDWLLKHWWTKTLYVVGIILAIWWSVCILAGIVSAINGN